MSLTIDRMTPSDWEAVRSIYQDGIATGDATFETRVPDREVWDRAHLDAPRLVARQEEAVVGWAAVSPVSERCVYGGVGEVSVYVASDARGQGAGKALLERLVLDAEATGLWTLQAGMFPENRASLALHRSCGFREVGTRRRLGVLQGRWRDVLLMERRSETVGT